MHNFKVHFLSILAGAADNFPMQLWDRLLQQAKIKVNLVCQSNGRAVDRTMLPALSAIASSQAAPTQAIMKKIELFLDYAALHPDVIVTYRASKMILALHSNASYLSKPKARSRAGGHFFLSENEEDPANNGAILNTAQIIRPVMSSAAEAELGAMFINA